MVNLSIYYIGYVRVDLTLAFINLFFQIWDVSGTNQPVRALRDDYLIFSTTRENICHNQERLYVKNETAMSHVTYSGNILKWLFHLYTVSFKIEDCPVKIKVHVYSDIIMWFFQRAMQKFDIGMWATMSKVT